MFVEQLGYTGSLNYIIDSKDMEIFPDLVGFALWWSSIEEGLLPTGLPPIVSNISVERTDY